MSDLNAKDRGEVPIDADAELESAVEEPEEEHGPPRFLLVLAGALRVVAIPFRFLARPLRWLVASRLRRAILVSAFGVVIVGAVGYGAFAYVWGRLHPAALQRVAVISKPTPKPTPKPTVDPMIAVEATLHGPNDPDFDTTQDPDAIVSFVRRLERVNEIAGKKLVINAMYRDNNGGDRYYLAVVTSCDELNHIFPPAKLAQRIEEPLRLADDFATFAFVQYDSDGQWGVASCGYPS